MRDDGLGRTCCTKGPPVLKVERVTGSSAPLGDRLMIWSADAGKAKASSAAATKRDGMFFKASSMADAKRS